MVELFEAVAATVSDALEDDRVRGAVVVALVELPGPALKNPPKAEKVPTARITKTIAVRAREALLFKADSI
jgi:hypothetical protein